MYIIASKERMKNSTVALRLRKGAWAAEEDILLRNCIEKHGEGKWHQVPQKAGLNRCRKSCRLRWLNYLRPNIKRGDFTSDEVDLMIRLHKLLGNRWSLIAGRLPGRTANDVKNYWNSHLQKKLAAAAPVHKLEAKKEDPNKTKAGASACICTCTLIKPLPRTFSKTTTNSFSTPNKIVDQSAGQNNSNNNNICNNVLMIKPPSPPTPLPSPPPSLSDDWWNNLLVEIGTHDHQRSVSMSSGGAEIDQKEAALGLRTDESSLATISGVEELGQNGWTDIWNLLNVD